MPRQVFTAEIEAFLETLEGVSSARVLTTPAGDVARVYVTATGPLESRGLRNSVTAALRSHFGIPIDPWRVYVTRLRAGAPPGEIPHFQVRRLEETATAAGLSVTVQLQWAQGPEERTASGLGRGRPGSASRARALAAATLAAARTALDVPREQLMLDRVGTVSFLDRDVVMVALSARPGDEPQTYIGAAAEDAAAHSAVKEPAIAATLDAVTRWLVQKAFVAAALETRDRRERLDAMRHFALDAAADRMPVRAPSLVAQAAGVAPNGQTAVREAAESPSADEVRPPAGDPAGEDPPGTDAQAKGGTAMAGLHHDARDRGSAMRGTTSGAGQAPRAPGMEETFYRSLVAERTPVHLRCRDGCEIPRAIVRDAGTYALLVETADGLELFFKHAIISIRVLPKAAAQA